MSAATTESLQRADSTRSSPHAGVEPGIRSLLLCALPGVLTAAVVLLSVLGRPFTLDDTLFLRQSEHLLSDPLHATAFEYAWFDRAERVSSLMPSGPVMAYLLLPTVLSGGAEWVAHLTQLLLVSTGVLATVSLGRRLGLGPRATASAGILLATTPAVLSMAATAMPDVAAMAFGALGMERSVAYRDERRWYQGASAAVALCLAILARSHLLLSLGVVLLFTVGRHLYSPKKWRRIPLMPLLILPVALVLTALAVVLTRDPQKQASSIWDAARGFTGSGATGSNFAAFCSHWVTALPLGIGWALIHGRRLLAGRLLWFCVLAMAVFLLRIDVPQWRWLSLVAGLGAAILADVLIDAFTRRDFVQSAFGAWLLLPTPILLYTHLPCKYAAACAPAVALLLARSASFNVRRVRMAVVAPCVALGLIMTVLIIRADGNLSELARAAARDWIAPEAKAGKRVWFAGHWGFQWYAERAGAKPLTADSPAPEASDLLVVSTESWAPMNLVAAVNAKTLLKTRQDDIPGGRVMRDGAGFYSNFWGYLPWTYSRLPSDSIQLWRVDEAPKRWP